MIPSLRHQGMESTLKNAVTGVSLSMELSMLAAPLAGVRLLLDRVQECQGVDGRPLVEEVDAGLATPALICSRVELLGRVIEKELAPRHLLTAGNRVRSDDGDLFDDVVIGVEGMA